MTGFNMIGFISIRSSRMGGDPCIPPTDLSSSCALISIHSSHTGRDYMRHNPRPKPPEFQSTLPIREETRGERCKTAAGLISIHSSHTGRDGHV